MEDEAIPPVWILKDKYNSISLSDSWGYPRKFKTRDEAIHYKEHNGYDDYAPAIYIDSTWEEREYERFRIGQYSKPTWYNEAWYNKNNQYCHVHPNEPEYIRYTESPEKGMQRLYIKSTPGKFLTKYYSTMLYATAIQSWADKHRALYSTGVKVHWAKTPEEIVDVYTMSRTFESCMQYSASHFPAKIHPAKVYGAGDLEVAYVKDDENRLLARALVWRDKKKVGRVYGDVPILINGLKAEGIESSSGNVHYDELTGAKLLKITDKSGTVILPYIDGRNCYVEEKDGELTLSDKDTNAAYSARNTNGYATEYPRCHVCSNRLNGGNTPYHSVIFPTVEGPIANGQWHSRYVCERHKEFLSLTNIGYYYKWDGTRGFVEDEEFGVSDCSDPTNVIWNKYPSILASAKILNILKSKKDNKYYNAEQIIKVVVNGKAEHWHISQVIDGVTTFVSEYSGHNCPIEETAIVGFNVWSKSELIHAWKGSDDKYYTSEAEYEVMKDLAKHDMFGGQKVYDFDFTKKISDYYKTGRYYHMLLPEYKNYPLSKEIDIYEFGRNTNIKQIFKRYINQKVYAKQKEMDTKEISGYDSRKKQRKFLK